MSSILLMGALASGSAGLAITFTAMRDSDMDMIGIGLKFGQNLLLISIALLLFNIVISKSLF
ncbi:MAG: hypothetical protein HY044_00495 [Candidatus Woesebacteria bacterium]|nr:MAG: hypothetical protein HY044_00495 [Candidatus Woesebacteria bacterium]